MMTREQLIGANIREYIRANGMRMQMLADKCGYAYTTIASVCLGKYTGNTANVVKAIAKTLNISVKELTARYSEEEILAIHARRGTKHERFPRINAIYALKARDNLSFIVIGERIGYDHVHVTRMAYGSVAPSYPILEAIGKLFGVTAEYLLASRNTNARKA